jgi:probable F420-dependent oxidoreductase
MKARTASRWSAVLAVASVDHIVGLAQKAEQVGVESLWTFEHVVVPEDYASAYPYSPNGKMGATPETNFVDPLIALAIVAANTTKVRLGTGVNILPQANPLLLAKQAASLDFVSGGRFMLGVGIGWLREEFDAMGVPFERRGARFDDYVEAMRKVWSGEVVEHESDFVTWTGFKSHPKPTSLPVIIGGTKGKAFLRTARHGDGYFAPNGGVDQMKALVGQLRAACDEVGRDFGTLEITGMWMGFAEGVEAIAQYADLGVHRLVVPLPALGGNPIEGIDKLGAEVIAAQ